MSRVCSVSGKGLFKGNKVSHSNNKRRKTWEPNLQTKRIFDTESGKYVRVRVSRRVLKTIDKKGLSQTLRDNGLKLSDIV